MLLQRIPAEMLAEDARGKKNAVDLPHRHRKLSGVGFAQPRDPVGLPPGGDSAEIDPEIGMAAQNLRDAHRRHPVPVLIGDQRRQILDQCPGRSLDAQPLQKPEFVHGYRHGLAGFGIGQIDVAIGQQDGSFLTRPCFMLVL